MKVTIEMIESKQFTTKPRGFDPQEVDEFLDSICDEMAEQLDQIQSLQQQLMSAQATRPAPVQEPVKPAPSAYAAPASQNTDAFREILEMAQKVKDETIAKAEEEAQRISDTAKTQADAKLKGLEDERIALEKQVAALKTAAADYRSKFEALLQAQQDAIEKAAGLF